MKKEILYIVATILLFCGCGTTRFVKSPMEMHPAGDVPEFKELSGIPVWISGRPNRQFSSIGVITDRKYQSRPAYDFHKALKRVARLAKKKHADGVIIFSRTEPPPEDENEEPAAKGSECDSEDDTNLFGMLLVGLFKGFVSPGHNRIPFEVTAVPIKFVGTPQPSQTGNDAP